MRPDDAFVKDDGAYCRLVKARRLDSPRREMVQNGHFSTFALRASADKSKLETG
jgi:hypothetical protein